jgi:hypothetical protein
MSRPMGQVKQLDERMNAAGYLRLMPTEMLAQNMSNRVPDEYRKAGPIAGKVVTTGIRRRLLERPYVKARLLALYDRIFRWYYE